jgi:hypothetical protein
MNVAAVGLSDFFVVPFSASDSALTSTSADLGFSCCCCSCWDDMASSFFNPYSSFFSSRLSSQYEFPAASFPVAASTSLVFSVGNSLTSSSTGLNGLLGELDSVGSFWAVVVVVVDGVSASIFSSDMAVGFMCAGFVGFDGGGVQEECRVCRAR